MQDWLSRFIETSPLSFFPLFIVAVLVVVLGWIILLIRGPRAVKLHVRGLGLETQVATTTGASRSANITDQGVQQ